MGELSRLPNIGKIVEAQLNKVGITSTKQLKSIGSKEAWLRIKRIDDSVCINCLCALEGALQGIRWHDLDNQTRQDLKHFYEIHR